MEGDESPLTEGDESPLTEGDESPLTESDESPLMESADRRLAADDDVRGPSLLAADDVSVDGVNQAFLRRTIDAEATFQGSTRLSQHYDLLIHYSTTHHGTAHYGTTHHGTVSERDI